MAQGLRVRYKIASEVLAEKTVRVTSARSARKSDSRCDTIQLQAFGTCTLLGV